MGHLALQALPLCWRWKRGQIRFWSRWEQEDGGLSELERTSRALHRVMESIFPHLKFKMEHKEMFPGNMRTTLNFKMWVKDSKIPLFLPERSSQQSSNPLKSHHCQKMIKWPLTCNYSKEQTKKIVTTRGVGEKPLTPVMVLFVPQTPQGTLAKELTEQEVWLTKLSSGAKTKIVERSGSWSGAIPGPKVTVGGHQESVLLVTQKMGSSQVSID